MSNSYQLTPHASGSKREFWAITWPLMLGLLSSTCMLFIDRLFLAKWNPLGLNAAVSAGMAYFMILVIPMGIVEVSEVLVGRLHGEDRHSEVGSAAWQMVWTSLGLLPFFLLAIYLVPFFLFSGTSNETLETPYFCTLMGFAVVQCMVLSLSGFFIGIGSVKVITASALIGNLANIVLDYWLIFGGGPLPAMGVVGAAIATGVAQLTQLLFLLILFWSKKYKAKYGTQHFGLNRPFLLEGLRIGLPSGVGRSIEVIAHFIFFRLVMSVGLEQMALAAIAQSIYILFSFIIDANCKGASTIVANLLGARQHGTTSKVLRAGFALQTLYFLILLALIWFFTEQIYYLFSAEEGVAILMTPELMEIFKRTLFGVSLFFLLDGFVWILLGFLTAAKDTRFVFWVSILVNWIAYVPPTYWLVGIRKGGADVAWGVVAGVSCLSCALYLWRYVSGRWLKHDKEDESGPEAIKPSS